MDEGEFCGKETSEVYYVIDQQDTYKADTGYNEFLGVEVMLQGTCGSDQMFKVAENLID